MKTFFALLAAGIVGAVVGFEIPRRSVQTRYQLFEGHLTPGIVHVFRIDTLTGQSWQYSPGLDWVQISEPTNAPVNVEPVK